MRLAVSEESTCLMAEIHHAAVLLPKVPLKNGVEVVVGGGGEVAGVKGPKC